MTLAVFCLLGLLPVFAAGLTVRVTAIPSAHQLEVIDAAQTRGSIRLAALQPPATDRQAHQAIKRLQTLTLGKSLLLEPVAGHGVLASYAGLSVNQKLLEDGLASIDPTSLSALPEAVARQFINAEEMARQHKRGIWAGNSSPPVVKYYQPYWAEPRIPAPIIRAPVVVSPRQ